MKCKFLIQRLFFAPCEIFLLLNILGDVLLLNYFS